MQEFLIEQRDGVVRIPGPASMPNLDYTEISALVAALALKLDASAYTAADVLAKLLTVDGSGSGVDADLLDGLDSTSFLSAATYTAADVLAKLITVDGSGSGLDADLLDGLNSTAFELAQSYTATDVLSKLLTVDGSGSGLDADLLDGINSTDYARLSQPATFTGGSIIASSSTPFIGWIESDQASVDEQNWGSLANGKVLSLNTYNSTFLSSRTHLSFTRGTGLAVTGITLGNATDNPTFTFSGTGAVSIGGALTVPGVGTFNLAGTTGSPSMLISSSQPVWAMDETDQASGEQRWLISLNTKTMQFSTADAANNRIVWATITRGTGNAITNIALGDTTNNNTYTFGSSGAATFTGNISAPQITANRFVPNSSTVPTNGLYLPNSNNPGLSANSTKVIDWTTTVVTIAGNLSLGTAGNKLLIKEGSNASMGRSTLVAGTVTVNNTLVTATSEIFLSVQSLGTVAAPKAVAVTARTAGTSFTITSADATDTSVVAWHIIEPA